MRRGWSCFGILAVLLAMGAAAEARKPKKASKPKYFVVFRETLEAPGLKTGLADQVVPLLLEEFKKYPEFVVNLPEAPTEPKALGKYLKKRRLKGYEINVRLTKLKKELRERRPGERFKTLSVTVAASLFGTSIPQKTFAVGGDGESTVELPVRVETERDVAAAKADALKDALQQAVVKTLRSLETGPMKPKPEKRRRRRRKKS